MTLVVAWISTSALSISASSPAVSELPASLRATETRQATMAPSTETTASIIDKKVLYRLVRSSASSAMKPPSTSTIDALPVAVPRIKQNCVSLRERVDHQPHI